MWLFFSFLFYSLKLVLKRAREESYAPNTNNSHLANNQGISKRKSPSPQPTPKIIVNPYHASLISTTQQEKSKILTPISTGFSAQPSSPVCLNGTNKKNKRRSKSPTKAKDNVKESFPEVRILHQSSFPDTSSMLNPSLGCSIAEEPGSKTSPNDDKKESDDKSDDGSNIGYDEDDFGGK